MNKKRILWLDYIRAIATILVILLHVSASYLSKYQDISTIHWMVGNVIDSFTRICVPLFFMISGYLFFRDRKPKTKNYVRIFTTIFFYSLISLIYLKFYRDVSVLDKIKEIFFQESFYHLWFLYVIPIIYLVGEFITVREVKLKKILILAFICFVLVNPKLSDITSLFGFEYLAEFHLDGNMIYYLLYALFGAMIGGSKISFNKRKRVVVSLILILGYVFSSVGIAVGTYLITREAGEFVHTFYDFSSVFVAIGSLCVFTLVRINEGRLEKLGEPLLLISSVSLPIYGVHAIFLEVINGSGYRDLNNPVLDIPLTFGITLLVSVLVGIVIKKIDIKRYVS